MPRASLLAGTLLLAALTTAVDAHACGGCFSPPAPTADQTVVQDAERVLFFRHPESQKSVVWVEVRYTGAAKDFGWVLPVPKVPKVSVGLQLVFDALDQRMRPRFELQYGGQENCRDPWEGCVDNARYDLSPQAGGFQDAASAADAESPAPGPGGVQVLEAGQTGPYDYAVVQGSEAKPLLDWLNERGYATPQKALGILDSHVKKGDVFVAIKLSNGKGVNEIRPVVLTMADAEPCVPLRLTSIAAAEEMSVVVTVAGEGRAIVKNHLNVTVNPVRIDWLSGGSNYPQVLAAAIDEAAGRAFATEYAQPGQKYQLTTSPLLQKGAQLPEVTDLLALGELALNQQLPVIEEVAQVVDAHAKLSAKFPGVSPLQSLANLRACAQYWTMAFGPPECVLPGGPTMVKADLQAWPVDGKALAAAFAQDIAGPVQAVAEALSAAPWVSRLAMRISPEEMDRDPIFAFNPTLPAVSNVQQAVRRQVCTDGWLPAEATRLELQGLGSWLFSGYSPVTAKDPRFASAPFAARVELLDETGGAQLVAPGQVELVDMAIAGATPGQKSLPEGMTLQPAPAWTPPPSDPPVTKLGPWQRPGDWCEPKAGWQSGKLPPVPVQVVGAPDVVGGDAGALTVGDSPGAPGGSAGACTAARTSTGQGLALGFVLLLLAVRLGRRRPVA